MRSVQGFCPLFLATLTAVLDQDEAVQSAFRTLPALAMLHVAHKAGHAAAHGIQIDTPAA